MSTVCSGCFKKFDEINLYDCNNITESHKTPLCKICSETYSINCDVCLKIYNRTHTILYQPNDILCRGCDLCISKCLICDKVICDSCMYYLKVKICNFCDNVICNKHNYLDKKLVYIPTSNNIYERIFEKSSDKVNICKKCSGIEEKDKTIFKLNTFIYKSALNKYLINDLLNIVLEYN